MMKKLAYLFLILLSACDTKEKKQPEKNTTPVVSNKGQLISFSDAGNLAFFKTEKVTHAAVTAELNAPAKIAATILPSGEGASQHIVLFENPELAANYTQLIQHQVNIGQIRDVNIKQKQIELERVKDLYAHNASTGQDLLNAQTGLSMEQSNLANEKAALIEHEAKLIAAGFSPEMLRKAPEGTAYVICDIPENQLGSIRKGNACTIRFTAFPNESFAGKIDGIADMVDNTTRMIKLRISMDNRSGNLKAGMFANVSFGVSEGNSISVNKSALVTVQGKNYVFVKTKPEVFERREVQAGQQIGDRILIFSGLSNGDEIAVEGVMQLKGLSFGY